MNTKRRSALEVKIHLESLEDRVTPVAMDPASAHMAVLTGAEFAHTNIIIRREAPPSPSNPPGHKGFKLHRLHHGTPLPPIPYLNKVPPVTTISVGYQPAVTAATNPPVSVVRATSTQATVLPPVSYPAITPPVAATLPANVAAPLTAIYQEFQAAGGKGPFSSSYGSEIEIAGSSVGVEIHGNGSNLDALLADMDNLGFQLATTGTTTDTIVGLIPIDALATAAKDPLTLSITPDYLPQQHEML